MTDVKELMEKLSYYENSDYSNALKKANARIAQLEAANIRAGQTLVSCFEYVDGMSGATLDAMRAALDNYKSGGIQ